MVRRKDPSIPSADPALGAATYAVFRRELRDSGCVRCALAAGRTRIVVDRGEPSARILVVGEAPGAEEDRQGLAFVGRSGRLLDGMLQEAGLDPARDILIANVVKCRPPGNRPPKAGEARTCMPYLRRQMELVAPRVLILLGATAVKHILPHLPAKGLTGRTGRFFASPEVPGVDILITFHPAYILRNPRRRPLMVSHLALATGRLAELVREGIPLN